MTPTVGFNYEEIEEKIMTADKKVVAGFWDVGGGEATQLVYTAICQGIRFQAVLFVIDISEEVDTVFGGIKKTAKGMGGKGNKGGGVQS